MNELTLLLIIFSVAVLCYGLERRVDWLAHISAVCLIIIIAMLLAQLGVVPMVSPIYDFMQDQAVLVALVLMTLGLHLNHVVKVPLRTMVLFAIGAIGSTVGGVVAGMIAQSALGPESFKLAAQLTASYIGGGENAVAMQKVFDIPRADFIALFAADNIVTSLWMAVTVWFASDSEKEVAIIDHDATNFDGAVVNIIDILTSFTVSLLVVWLSTMAASKIGLVHKVLWLSIFALIAGHIPWIRNHLKSSYLLGAVLFSGFFFSIGAMSDLRAVFGLPLAIIVMPFIVVGCHAGFVFTAARLLKVSRSSTSVVSQVLIGGPATAVAVAQARKWKSGISIGIILGVLGYAIANFFGVLVHRILMFLAAK